MKTCPKCKSEIKISKFGTHTVEAKCNCQKARYFTDSGNDDDARESYIRKLFRNSKPSVQPSTIKTEPVSKSTPQNIPISKIEEYFPTNIVPRDIQKQILKEIETSIKSGFKKIVISAPTGVGKSAVGVAIAKYFKDGFFITKSKSLQDQYTRDYSFLRPVKGKSNFECLKIMEKQKVDDPILAKELGYTCEKGDCVEGTEKNENGKDVTVFCRFKRPLSNVTSTNTQNVDDCSYYFQKYFGLVSSFSVWNYSAFFQLMQNESVFKEHLQKKVSIFDEAHGIEDQIIQFIGINISKNQLDECQIDIGKYDILEIDELLEVLNIMRQFYGTQIAELEKRMEVDKEKVDVKLLGRFESNFKNFANAINEINNDPGNFIIQDSTNDYANSVSVSIKPLRISNYVEDFFKTEYQIFMSATIDKKSFCETMGFDESEIAFIDTPKSPFPYEHRQVEFLDMGILSAKSPPEVESGAIRRIDELLTKHADERGLILTQSKSRCWEILRGLSPENKKRIRICHSTNNDGKTQDDIIDEHRKNRASVLLSSSLWEGVDLKDEDSRFQIIAKVPYKSLGDPRVREKMKKFPLWYDSQTIMTILQGFGRSIRSNDDWAITYVIDSKIHELVNKTQKIIPKAYHDVLGIENVS